MKRTIVTLLVAWAFHAGLPAAPMAQEMSEEQMQAWMEAVSPNEHHAALDPLTGSWSHDLTFWQAPDAEPMTMTATSEAKWIMGGRYVVSDYTGEFMGMPFEGRDLIGYDNAKEKYFSVWIDNMSTGPLQTWGTYDADTRILTFEGTTVDPMSGEEIRQKSTVKILDDGRLLYESYMPGPDGEMYRHMEIHSTKTG
ncbi:MAG: DUF1579 domain-containing protein [Gemmatimonadota bacterium]|nr:DUF1579 domain-containing protein [Gemmatimonadota bacterium]